MEAVEMRGAEQVLTDEALAFVTGLHERFEDTRQELLRRRAERMARLLDGGTLDFLDETRAIRHDDWSVAPPPPELQDRREESTGVIALALVAPEPGKAGGGRHRACSALLPGDRNGAPKAGFRLSSASQ